MSESEPWGSALSTTSADRISIRGFDIAELAGNVGFASVLYLLYTGELPDPGPARLMDALMVASIDHGPATPSASAARLAVSGGGTLQAAGAAGLLTMGKYHGAAVEDALDALQVVIAGSDEGREMAGAAEQVVRERLSAGVRMSGFGHREHKERDPRVVRLFAIADETGVAGPHIDACLAVEAALKRVTGKELPINIDGALAAALGDLGFPPKFTNAVFMVARLAGVLGHAAEEREMPPMRHIDFGDPGYIGPAPRSLSKEEPL